MLRPGLRPPISASVGVSLAPFAAGFRFRKPAPIAPFNNDRLSSIRLLTSNEPDPKTTPSGPSISRCAQSPAPFPVDEKHMAGPVDYTLHPSDRAPGCIESPTSSAA